MKRINLISALAIAAMAALSLSCQKEGDMASKTREVSFDLSLNDPETKFSMTEETDGLKAAWEIGDKVSVMWGVDSDQYEEFTVVAIKDGGKTATFTKASSAMPADCTIGVYYPSSPYDGPSVYPYVFSAGTGTQEDDSWTLANAGKKLVYGANGITVTGGVIPAISLEQKTSFLLIKKGTKIAGFTASGFLYRENLHYLFWGNNNTSLMKEFTDNTPCKVTISTSETVPYDIYIPFIADGTSQSPVIIVTVSGSVRYTKDLGAKVLMPGKVYDISAKLDGIPSD